MTSSMVTSKNRQELETRGYTVVQNVLSEEECQLYIQEFVEWIETNFDEGEFPSSQNSLIQRYSIAHLSPTWSVRLKAKPVFADLWGTEELLTSLDAVAIGRPPEQGQEDFHVADTTWLHLDQGPGRLGLHAYQGAVYLEAANMDDWVFECMEGSHKEFERFYKAHPEERASSLEQAYDNLRLDDRHVQWYRHRGCLRRRVAVPKGGLLLWDSRLVHCNARPIKGRSNPDRWRFVVLVSMGPATWADKATLAVKKKAYRDLRMTSHWPCNGVRLFPVSLPEGAPRARHPLKALPIVATSMEAMQLAGATPYKPRNNSGEETQAADGGGRTIPPPQFSPDYKPPQPSPSPSGVSSCTAWVVVAVVSVVVCAVSVGVYMMRAANKM